MLNALEHRNDNPSAIPSRELAKLIYGPGSVYAREPTPEQVLPCPVMVVVVVVAVVGGLVGK